MVRFGFDTYIIYIEYRNHRTAKLSIYKNTNVSQFIWSERCFLRGKCKKSMK